MSVPRTSLSPLGQFVAAKVKIFMTTNASAAIENGTVDDGVGAISEAIGYGVACALGSPLFLAALTAGVGPVGAGAQQVASLTPNVVLDQA